MRYLKQVGFFRSGHPRFYVSRRGHKDVPLPDLPPDHLDWLAAYQAALEAFGDRPPRVQNATGTIGAACRAYLASDVFLALAASSRPRRRALIEAIEGEFGPGRLKHLTTQHIRIDLARLTAHPANAKLKAWRALCRWSVDAGLAETDAARDVRPRATPKTEGFRPWTRADVAAFRAHWPRDSAQRLAFELMHRTCASIGDACRLGPGNVKDGWLSYRRLKSGSEAVAPMTGGPAWFEPDDELAGCLAHRPKALTFLATTQGKPRSPKAATQWFARACRDAGLPHVSAHGIRKHRAAVFKENGASEEQRMAILGHETRIEAANYSKSADLKKTIAGTDVSNFSANVSN